VFQNVGTENSDAGESPNRKNTTFTTRLKFEIKSKQRSFSLHYSVYFGEENGAFDYIIIVKLSSCICRTFSS